MIDRTKERIKYAVTGKNNTHYNGFCYHSYSYFIFSLVIRTFEMELRVMKLKDDPEYNEVF